MRARFALSTLTSPWLVVPALVILVLQAVSLDVFMTGELLLTADSAGLFVALAGPILTGLTAFDSSRTAGPALGGVFSVAAARRRQSMWLAAWGTAPLAITLWLTTGTRVALDLSQHGDAGALGAVALTMLLHGVALAFFCGLGIVVGRAVPPIAAGALGLGAGYLATIVGAGARGDRFGALDLGGATVSRLGLSLDLKFLAAQLIVLAGAAAAAIILPGLGAPGPSRRRRSAGVWAVVTAALLLAPVPGLPTSRWVLAPEPPSACAGDSPRVCTYPEHARQAGLVMDRLSAYAKGLHAGGYGALAPTTVEEYSRSYNPSGANGIRGVDLATYDDSTEARRDLVFDLVTPVHCPQLEAPTPPPDAYFDTVDRLAATVAQIVEPDVVATIWDPRPLSPPDAEAAFTHLWSCSFS